MVAPNGHFAPFGAGQPRSSAQAACDAERTVQAGGALADLLLHESVKPFQRIFRVLPSNGIHRATKNRPFQFVVGSFTTDNNQGLILSEYRFQPYRFDGVIAGEAVPLEDRRLPLSVGYDVTVGANRRPGNITAQMIPARSDPNLQQLYPANQTGGTMFPSLVPNVVDAQEVDTLYGRGTVSNTGFAEGLQPQPMSSKQYIMTISGASLLPQTQEGFQGPSRLPFTYYVNTNEAVALTVGIFAPVRIPIAFFEGTLAGYLVPKESLERMLNAVRPCT